MDHRGYMAMYSGSSTEFLDSVCSGEQYIWHLVKAVLGPSTSFTPC